MMDGNRSYIFHLKYHFFFIVLASIECSLVSCSSCFFHWLFHSFIEKVIGRINVHFPVAHQYSYTCTTFIQYGHKKNIGRINVHFFPLGTSIQSYLLARDFTEYCRVGIARLNRLEKLRLIHKADFIDSWEDMSGEGISESSERRVQNISLNFSDTHANLLCSSGEMKCFSVTERDLYHGPHTLGVRHWKADQRLLGRLSKYTSEDRYCNLNFPTL